jgi:hypothetical protein
MEGPAWLFFVMAGTALFVKKYRYSEMEQRLIFYYKHPADNEKLRDTGRVRFLIKNMCL